MAVRPFLLNLLFYLSSGAFLCLGLTTKTFVTRRRFLLHGFLAVFCSLLCLVSISVDTPLPLQWGLVIFSVSAALYVLETMLAIRGKTLFYWIAFAATLFVISFEVLSRFQDHPDWSLAFPALLTNAFLSTGLLGAAVAFLFWQPVPLARFDDGRVARRLVVAFLIFLAVRFCFSAYLATALIHGHDGIGNFRLFLSFHPGLLVFVRWLWGIAAPLVLLAVIFTALPRARSLFYLMVFFVLTGESLGLYLALYHHLAV